MNIKRILRVAVDRETEFTRMYQDLEDAVKPSKPREVYLRPSSLPVCSLTLLNSLVGYNNGELGEWSYGADFFCGVGTTVHEVAQAWCSLSGEKVWGNWYCPNCKSEWKYTHESTCKKCGTKAEYREIEIEAYGFKGHIDCILLTKKGVLVCDFKTSTYFKQRKDFKYLNVAYALQILIYCIMLKRVWGAHFEKLGYPMRGASLLFISRDMPFKTREVHFPLTPALESMARKMAMKATLGMELAKYAVETGDLSLSYKYRNCKSKLDYLNRVKPFHVYDDCPLWNICHDKKQVARLFKNRLKVKNI